MREKKEKLESDSYVMWGIHYLLITTLIVGLVGALGYALLLGIDESEVAECLKLRDYSKRYELFWLAEWQKDMCDRHGIEIHAPVGNPYE